MESIKKIADELETPLLLFSANEFKKSYQSIQQYLPNVKHHYALKPLPLQECVELIEECKGYLDVASKGEFLLVENVNKDLLAKCIYTHPIKTISDIDFALEKGVKTMVVENIFELEKLIPYASKVQLLFRISFSNHEALCNLSEKFGLDENQFKELLSVALEHNFEIIGCSFHVGSQMKQPFIHVAAIEKCKELYDWAHNTYGINFPVLDIGGGFPSKYDESDSDLKSYCQPINSALVNLFPNTEIWSEPGRSIAANSMISVTRVIGKAIKNDRIWYYLDDGVYHTYSGLFFESMKYDLYPLVENTNSLKLSVFAGPTCDACDVVMRDVMFPELEIGDCVFSKRIGAYSWASRSNFNLLGETKIVHHDFDLEEVENYVQALSLSEMHCL